MNSKNFSQAQFSKLRNGISGDGEYRNDTICSQNFESIVWLVWKLLGGTKIVHRHTHIQTHAHTDIHRHTQTHTDTHRHKKTHTHTHTPAAHFMSFFLRNKTKNDRSEASWRELQMECEVHVSTAVISSVCLCVRLSHLTCPVSLTLTKQQPAPPAQYTRAGQTFQFSSTRKNPTLLLYVTTLRS